MIILLSHYLTQHLHLHYINDSTGEILTASYTVTVLSTELWKNERNCQGIFPVVEHHPSHPQSVTEKYNQSLSPSAGSTEILHLHGCGLLTNPGRKKKTLIKGWLVTFIMKER